MNVEYSYRAGSQCVPVMRSMLLRTAVSVLFITPLMAYAQHGSHGAHPPMPDQVFFFQCERIGNPSDRVEVVLDLPSTALPGNLNQAVRLPWNDEPITLKQYLPSAVLKQNVKQVPGDQGAPAIRLFIKGAKQSYAKWLISNDSERNRLTSLVANWRYMAVENETQRKDLLDQYKQEYSLTPTLYITSNRESIRHAITVGSKQSIKLESPPGTIRVLRYFPHFGFDEETGKAVNQSDNATNPAVELEINWNGHEEKKWIFAKFPGFSESSESGEPLKIRLDCPVKPEREVPDFLIITTALTRNEVWSRVNDEISKADLSLQQKIEIPGSRYSFRVEEFVVSGRLVEEYMMVKGKKGVPSLEVAISNQDTSKRETLWLPLGKSKVIRTKDGPMRLSFSSQPMMPSKGHH